VVGTVTINDRNQRFIIGAGGDSGRPDDKSVIGGTELNVPAKNNKRRPTGTGCRIADRAASCVDARERQSR